MKKEWKGILFWVFFPLFMTILIIATINPLKAEMKIPVGIVLEDEHALSYDLYKSIAHTPYIRPFLLDENEALHKLQKHELDTVFVIDRNYGEMVYKGNRNNLITSYRTERSFTYVPLKELVISYVYEDFIRSNATHHVQQLQRTYDSSNEFNKQYLIDRSKEIEKEQDLLKTQLTFKQNQIEVQDSYLIDPWHIWIFFTFLSTLLLFDWVIKENELFIKQRFTFGKYSFKYYLVINSFFYMAGLVLIDLIIVCLLAILDYLYLSLSLIFVVVSFRIVINLFSFLLTFMFRSIYFYYIVVFIIFCFTGLIRGVIVPIDGLMNKYSFVNYIDPLGAPLSYEIFNPWLFILVGCFIIWLLTFKGGRHA